MLQDLHEVGFAAKSQDGTGVAGGLEHPHDGFARAGVHLFHHCREFLLRTRQIHTLRATEARGHGLLRLGDDARALRRIGETLEHGVAPALLRPARNDQRAKTRLPGEVRIGIGRGVGALARGLIHRREQRAGGALFQALRLHVGDDGNQSGLLPNGDRLGDAHLRAVVRFGRDAIVISEVGARRPRHVDHLDDFLGAGKVARLVVESGRHAPRALLQPIGDERAHLLDLGRRWALVGVAVHRLPRRVEPNVAADVHRQAGSGQRRHLLRDVERAVAIGVEDLSRDALRQHVHRRRQRVRRRVAVDVDEAGGDEQPTRVDVRGRRRGGKVANRGDEAVADTDIAVVARIAAAVDDGAVADDDVEAWRLGLNVANRQADEARSRDADRCHGVVPDDSTRASA